MGEQLGDFIVNFSTFHEAGDAYYAPPGHFPVVEAGTEGVEFSTAAEYAETLEVLSRNLASMQGS